MNPIRWRKRAMFVGCSHGGYLCPRAADAVIAFEADFRPHHRVHLGDALDTAAFRSGAAGTKDEGESVGDDFDAGAAFIRRYRPTLWRMGNHEDRLFSLASHPRAIIACAAQSVVKSIYELAVEVGAQVLPYGGTAAPESWTLFGDTLVGHGYMFNEMATRDHVEMLRGYNVIHAHNHKCGMAAGRAVGAPMGYSVGTLATVAAMGYAKTRRATAAWSGGIVYGEYGSDWSRWQIHLLHTSPPVSFAAPRADEVTQ